jgi:hypothetical protein
MDAKFQHNGTSSHWITVLVEDHLPFVLQIAAVLPSYLLTLALLILLLLLFLVTSYSL